MTMLITFDQIVYTVMQLPTEQQKILADLIRFRNIENRRCEIARDARDSLPTFN